MFHYVQSRHYRSSEIILGDTYGPEIDIWSFAHVLAEMFTGHALFAGEDERSSCLRVCSAKATRLRPSWNKRKSDTSTFAWLKK